MSSKRHGPEGSDLGKEKLSYYHVTPDIYRVTQREDELESFFNSGYEHPEFGDIDPFNAELSFYRLPDGREYGVIEVDTQGGETEYCEILGRVEENRGRRILEPADDITGNEAEMFFDGDIGMSLEPGIFNR